MSFLGFDASLSVINPPNKSSFFGLVVLVALGIDFDEEIPKSRRMLSSASLN